MRRKLITFRCCLGMIYDMIYVLNAFKLTSTTRAVSTVRITVEDSS